ncbi:MAG: hypothetical protein ACRDYD_04345 [Acidimicrobiales bacterium]
MGVRTEVELRRLARALERSAVSADQAVGAVISDHGEEAAQALFQLLVGRGRPDLARDVTRSVEARQAGASREGQGAVILPHPASTRGAVAR